MRFRLTLLIGLGVGYVLGAKAGRERYEQILELWRQFQGSETGQQLSEQASGLADQAVHTFESKASEGMEKAKGAMSESSSGSGGGGGTAPT